MAWIESHEDLPNHPKTRKLARLLGINIPQVVGHLHCLWYWTLKYADDGVLTRFDEADIEGAMLWDGEPGKMAKALIDTKFLDKVQGELTGHDWNDYAGRLVQQRKANRARMVRARASHVPIPSGATVPNRTVPNRTREKGGAIASPPSAEKKVTVIDQPFRERMYVKHSDYWTPTQTDEQIDDAMSHKARHKWDDLQRYVQNWLRGNAKNGTKPKPKGDFDNSGDPHKAFAREIGQEE